MTYSDEQQATSLTELFDQELQHQLISSVALSCWPAAWLALRGATTTLPQ